MAAGEVMDLEVMARRATLSRNRKADRNRRARSRRALRTVITGLVFLAIGALNSPSPTPLPSLPFARAADPTLCPVVFAVADPSDGETMSAVASIRIEHCLSDLDYVTVEYEGNELETAPVAGSDAEIELDTTILPNGQATLWVKAFDHYGNLLTLSSVSVVISNPILVVTEVDPGHLEFEVAGLPSDMVFVIVVSDRLRESFFPEYGIFLPIQSSSSWILTAGGFPLGYDGSDVSVSAAFPPTPSSELYAVLLSWSPQGWLASRPAIIQP